jgi:hypothetical protein
MTRSESTQTSPARRYVTLCLWLVVVLMFFSLAKQWIVLTSSDKEFTEYVESVLRRAAIDHRPAKEIRTLLLVKAEQLSIPVSEERIDVTGQGHTLGTVIAYDREIKVPMLGGPLYRMEFRHNLSYEPQR